MKINSNKENTFYEKYYAEKELVMQSKLVAEFTKLRIEKGLSQKELADTLGISETSISEVEEGKQNLTMALSLSLAVFFEKELVLV